MQAKILKKCVFMTHGVMVALQILVLSVQVRILVGQRNEKSCYTGYLRLFP